MAIFRKKKKKKGLLKKALTFMILPIAISLGIAFVWWANDQFWLYAQLFVLDNEVSTSNGTPNSVAIGGNNWGINGAGTSGSGVGSSYGASGLNLALLNNLGSGYCGDFLTIMRDHANWTYMPDSVNQTGANVPLNALVGMAFVETGGVDLTVNGTTVKVPYTAIRPEQYNAVSGLDLYTVNSAWFQTYGTQYINDSRFSYDATRLLTGVETSRDPAHTQSYQFSNSFFCYYPAGHLNSEAGSYSVASRMTTGFNMSGISGESRTKNDTDAAYFPDVIACLIRSGYGRVCDYVNVDLLDDKEVALSSMHLGHHSNQDVNVLGIVASLSSNSPTARMDCNADALNMYTAALKKCYAYFAVHIDNNTLEFDLTGREGYAGLGAGIFIAEYDAFFPTSSDKDIFMNSFNSNSSFKQGVILGVTISKGTSVSESDVLALLNSTSRVRSLGSAYPSDMRMPYSSGTYNLFVESDQDVIYADGNGTVTHAIHGFYKNSLFWIFADPLYGSWQMWQMLKVSGVDCTYAELMGSGSGSGSGSDSNLIDKIPTYTNVAVPSTVNAVAATIAVMYAWTTRDEGLTTWGTALYRRGWHDVIANDWITRSCDRCAMTAVYWAGMTNSKTVTYGGCSNIIKNLDSEVKLGHFEKVKEFDGTSSTIQYLMPGDIIINSGHIMLYVGSDIVQAIYPGVDSEYDMVHGSIGSRNQVYYEGSAARSPNLDKLKNNLSTSNGAYMAYRCLVPMSDPKHTDAISATEMLWLFNNPKAGVYLCTFNSSGAVTNRSEFLNGLPYMP